jgi:hypothetical protein
VAIHHLSVLGDSLPLIAQAGFGAGGMIHFSTKGWTIIHILALVKTVISSIMTALTTIIRIATAIPMFIIPATGGLDHAKSGTL